MTHDEAVQKVAKLLRLAKSSNEHEAALAASMAQSIMDRYKIATLAAEVDNPHAAPDEPLQGFDAAPLEPGATKFASWKVRLLHVLTKANQAFFYTSPGRGFILVGRASDVETVRYLYAWLVQEVERLAEALGKGLGTTWRNNFRIGAVLGIGEKMAEQHRTEVTLARATSRAESMINPHAIVRMEKALATLEKRHEEVKEWAQVTFKLRMRSASRSTYNSNAREKGREAGRKLEVGKARRALA